MRSKHTNTLYREKKWIKSEEKLAGKEGIQTRKRCRSQRCSDSESIRSNNEPCPKQRRKMSDRANWTRENEAQFIVFCHQEYTNGQLLTTCFSRPVLGQICDRLNALVAGHSVFTLDHLKTKWKNIKKAWKLLYGLRFTRGSGLGWDPEREIIVGTEDQLEAIYAEHRDNKAIIKRGLPHFEYCSEMFGNKIATGQRARSTRQPVVNDGENANSPASGDEGGPSHSAYNFTPSFLSNEIPTSSRSSGRKRSSGATERDVVLVEAMKNFNGYITEKRAKPDKEKEEYNTCLAIVSAMELPTHLKIRAGERLTAAPMRFMFLQFDEHMRRNWMISLESI